MKVLNESIQFLILLQANLWKLDKAISLAVEIIHIYQDEGNESHIWMNDDSHLILYWNDSKKSKLLNWDVTHSKSTLEQWTPEGLESDF